MIKIDHLTIAYQQQKILNDINLVLPSNQIIGIIGPNGAGKSTLLKGLLSLVKKQSGTVTVDDIPIETIKNKVAYVPQKSEVDLSFPITVYQTVLMGTYPNLKWFERPSQAQKDHVNASISKLGIEDLKTRGLDELSGGQLQRVFIARALAQQAEILLLDEPFVGIDVVSEQVIVRVLKELKEQGKTILMVHHDLAKVAEYFDYVLLVNKGIVANGTTSKTFTPANLEKTYGQWFGQIKGTDRGEENEYHLSFS